MRRDAGLTRRVGRWVHRDPFVVEQWSFAVGLVPLLLSHRPEVILFSEWSLGKALGRWRTVSRQAFRLLLCNGAPGWPPFDRAVDHVQQITPNGYRVAIAGGDPPERHTVLPLGLNVARETTFPSDDDRALLRARLGLPHDRRVALSVAALNNHHKRLNYLIDELASLPEPRPHLVMLGQREAETPGILARARERLGTDGFTARTVPSDDVADYYRAADVFVLASTTEGMGRVFLEAMAVGLPVLAHAYPITDYVLGGHGLTADLRQPGELARLMSALGPDELAPERRAERHRWVYEQFSWEALAPRYVDLLLRVARGGPSPGEPRPE
jgi:glycosyltransferase involved in cell wall biosynthesis